MTPWSLAVEGVVVATAHGDRLVTRLRLVLAELTRTACEVRDLVRALALAVEDGFLDEVRLGLRELPRTVALIEHVSGQIEQALPVLDATTPTLGMVNATLDQLNATVAQLDALPGVRIARRIVRPDRSASRRALEVTRATPPYS
jgi:hypothetical protein